MFSFAPFRYRRVFAEHGGPIARTESGGTLEVAGRHEAQVNAFLRPELAPGKMRHSVYSNADGSGSAESPSVAQHKAISEAIERWAFLTVHDSGEGVKFGFGHDRSSNGMAAFPGFEFQARKKAYFEALERWALIGWWAGHFGFSRLMFPGFENIGAIRIHHDRPGEVVVLYRRIDSRLYSYGHAADSTLLKAAGHAGVELARTAVVLAAHRAKGVLASVENFMERRAVYFSTAEGFSDFEERLSRKAHKPAPAWKTLFDGEIRGPWSKWSTVWRHCVEMPTRAYLNPEENFFFW